MSGMRWELGPWSEPWTAKPGHREATFRSTWNQTLRLLADETGRLDAGLVVVEIDTEMGSLTRDRHSVRPPAAPRHPGVRVVFESRHGRQRFATAEYTYWRDNVRAVALALTALRAVDRYGVSRGEQYVGFRPAIGAGPSAPDPDLENPRRAIAWMTSALRDFGELEGGTPDQVYRRLARRLHPDHGGGDADTWQKLQSVKVLLESVKVL